MTKEPKAGSRKDYSDPGLPALKNDEVGLRCNCDLSRVNSKLVERLEELRPPQHRLETVVQLI